MNSRIRKDDRLTIILTNLLGWFLCCFLSLAHLRKERVHEGASKIRRKTVDHCNCRSENILEFLLERNVYGRRD